LPEQRHRKRCDKFHRVQQGERQMANSQAIVCISQEVSPGMEKEFNDWYFNVHIQMALKYPGMVKATRCRLTASSNGQKGYLTVFEFKDREMMEAFIKSPEAAAAIEEMNRRWNGKLPFEIKWRNEYEIMETWEK
jgi:antibiotic biosynthesis monooxygenase (ABM) superfamily enzyme